MPPLRGVFVAVLFAGVWFGLVGASRADPVCRAGYYHDGNVREEYPDRIVVRPRCRRMIEQGDGLVGGMTWIAGFNARPGALPELRRRQREMLMQQFRASNIAWDEACVQRYNFIIGIAASTDRFQDLRSRVVFDEFSNGQFTANEQAAYNSLRGRNFQQLDCHSNGAMICLAALQNEHVGARRVALYGPQITPESLAMWNALVTEGRVEGVDLYINQNDPVPPTALLSSNPALAIAAPLAPFLTGPMFFNADWTGRGISAAAPNINVHVGPCTASALPSMDCHDMRLYGRR
jgi:hypothetical protein